MRPTPSLARLCLCWLVALWLSSNVMAQLPTAEPSPQPTVEPTVEPTPVPSPNPTSPTAKPTLAPTAQKTIKPTNSPVAVPTVKPTGTPTAFPTRTRYPSKQPTGQPTRTPSGQPTRQPTAQPSGRPTRKGPYNPTATPTPKPTFTSQPTYKPSTLPTLALPVASPTMSPTAKPTVQPTPVPTVKPTAKPSLTLQPTRNPTPWPSVQPTPLPTRLPSAAPTPAPTSRPTLKPTANPTLTFAPTDPTGQPSGSPTGRPSRQPTSAPTGTPEPSGQPTCQPSAQPSHPTGQPTRQPSGKPTRQPTRQPTSQPTSRPSHPTGQPSSQPTTKPTKRTPTPGPSPAPTAFPTPAPSPAPTAIPSPLPSKRPNINPTGQPTRNPTGQPSMRPTGQPSGQPTMAPTIFLYATSSPTAVYSRENVTGTVTFFPTTRRVCQDVEIRILFKSTLDISSNITHRINTPGLTTQGCSGLQKNNTRLGMLLQTSLDFIVYYFEGIYANSFLGSYITVQPRTYLYKNTYYRLDIDRSNGLQRTCPTNNTWSVTRYAQNDTYLVRRQAGVTGSLVPAYYSATECYVVNSSIAFFPPMQQFQTSINITLTLGFTIQTGDYLTVYLPGFTNNKGHFPINPVVVNSSTYYVGKGKSRNVFLYGNVTQFTTAGNMQSHWTGNWHEGSNSSVSRTAWSDPSKLVLYPNRVYPAGVPFWVFIDRYPNSLVSLCGRPPNYPAFRFKVTSSNYYTNSSSFLSAGQIGDGCKSQNYCSSNGNCDFCRSKCTCFNGFGSPSDKLRAVSDDFNADCSSRTCPSSPALWAAAADFSTTGFHRQVECSNNGLCQRQTGVCRCFPGYSGAACERMGCPGDPSCSGRGVCKALEQLALDGAALPLSRSAQTYHDVAHATDIVPAVLVTNLTTPYDGGLGHGCVCDSAWAVGLGANQTQEAEYFGAACEFRRCPSGDDPKTVNVNELNCTGLARTGGRDVGQYGNLCHIDCSNQGVCDYSTGTCTCFEGFYGANCGKRVYYGV